MIKYIVIPAVIILTSCGQQTPESVQQLADDQVAIALIEETPIAQPDPAPSETQPEEQPGSPFEVVEDQEPAEPGSHPDDATPDPQVDQDPEPEIEESEVAQSEPPTVIDDAPAHEDQPGETGPEPPVNQEDLLQDDVIEPDWEPVYPIVLIEPDLYVNTLLRHEWVQYEGSTAIAPSPINIVTMQITWDMQPGHTYQLRLEGIPITDNIASVWEFEVEQVGLSEDFDPELLPYVEIKTCTIYNCVTSSYLDWGL